MNAQVPTSDRPEFTALAMRGSLIQAKKGGAPAVLPNKFGYMTDGTQEPTTPSSAPVARWNMANRDGSLCFGLTLSNGINPVQVQQFRENSQLHLYIDLQPVNPESTQREPDGPVYLKSNRDPA